MEENPNQNQNEKENLNEESVKDIQQEQVKEQPKVEANNQKTQNVAQGQKKKSNTGLIVGIIIGIILLISIPIIIIVTIILGAFGAKNLVHSVKEEVQSNINQTDLDNELKNMLKNNTTSNNTTSKNTTSKNTTTNNTTSKEVSSSNVKESTLESPLNINEWGLASKFVSKNLSKEYEDTNYIDVPVRVTKVTRGDDAEKIVKEWFDNQKYYKYEEPKANTEWVVINYQVDLSDVKFDAGTIGTDTKINSAVKGLTGGSVKYNDITYILSTHDMSNSEYVKKAGVYDGQFFVTLPEGCKDYLVKLGDSYNGAESYFRVEK